VSRADRIEVYQDDSGEWRWRLTAPNGETIADSSEGYVDRDHAETMAQRVAPHAEHPPT
jgi:uncharacterized protein YegP (UPF0339 family)